MLTPIYGFVEGDTMGLLVLCHDDWTIEQVSERLREMAAVRVRPSPPFRLERDGLLLDPKATVASAGLESLCRVDLKRER